MTKHVTDDGLPKYHMPLEEANKIIENNMKTLDCTAFVGCGAHLTPNRQAKPKFTPAKARVSSFKSRLGKIMHRLYDLEPDNEPEKPLNVDLGVDLYQMENY